MEVKVCSKCRRLFNYMYGPDICPDCLREEPEMATVQEKKGKRLLFDSEKSNTTEDKELFESVKDYIVTHPRATVMQIAEANETTPSKLLDWVRDGRLEFTDESKEFWFECVSCSRKIRSGRLCNRCMHKH